MEAEAEPNEEPTTEELKEIKAQEETGSITMHIPVKMEEPKEQPSPNNAISEKKELRGDETVVLTKECSALVQKKLPPKMLGPRSFLIPCTIGTITFEKVLCDLGSSINLMPLFVMRKLGIQEVQPTRISVEMADKSLKRAYSMVENILVKVEDLYLPVNFVILDTGEDKDNSIILGRP
ncbi:uncharacterized protein LOC107646808 [Arachis ipaensis]|uniref:uncharacterized protein LOC107646808 n=1 Tax=Arachis ipaensis TaxID=130454 RepID=UPI0007AFD110|nr:uncharacterized protein LOC107646808 [Arachis ipaensis]